MKLEKYIKQLLPEHEMVIVPGFGAFISEYLPAEVDDASGEIRPPSSKLIFNPKIKNNDGLLVGKVADSTRCTHFEALQKIEKERDNFIYRLDKGEKLELDGLGILLYNAEKQVLLVSKDTTNFSLDSFGLETTHIKQLEETAKEEIQEVTPILSPENVVVAEVPNENAEETPGETPVTAENEELAEVPEENPVAELEKNSEDKTTRPAPEEKKKRKAGWLWLLLILIPLLAVSIFLFLKKYNAPEPVQISKQEEAVPVVQDTFPTEDSLAVDSVTSMPADTVKITEEAIREQVEEETGPKYYLIGGSFKSEENAETYRQGLIEKGFEPFHLGKYGNFYIVGIGKYNSENEASAAKRDYLEKNPGSGVWILEQ